MKTIEIITHCWRYSRVLNYQLSSLALHPPKHVKAYAHVFYSHDDKTTRNAIDWHLRNGIGGTMAGAITYHGETTWAMASALPTALLLNRAIGRNLAAKHTRADIVWFCDADYFFGEGALDVLAEADSPATSSSTRA